MQNNAIRSYQMVAKETLSGRETEARVLTQGALKLQQCQKNWNAPGHKNRLDDALKYNQRIWSIFQTEVSNPDNPLPRQIKINILQLSRYIDKIIFKTMAFPTQENLDMIIKINNNIAAGLRGSA
ncbi:MAG: flagellar biosynthesis regulator FlaF [Desulfobacteraceae bacterium]|jgi:flagellar protein FlaF